MEILINFKMELTNIKKEKIIFENKNHIQLI